MSNRACSWRSLLSPRHCVNFLLPSEVLRPALHHFSWKGEEDCVEHVSGVFIVAYRRHSQYRFSNAVSKSSSTPSLKDRLLKVGFFSAPRLRPG